MLVDRMTALAPAPRLRPTALSGIAAATLAAVLQPQRGGFDAFEADAAQVLGVRHAVAVGSARAGLAAILAQCGVRSGDEIIVPSYTAPCVPAFLRARGYRLRIAAVCPRRLVMTGATVAAALTPRTRAVLPTHVEGVTAPVEEIAAALPAGVALIEDAAHAIGAEVDARPVGTRGAGAVGSFGKGKHINTVAGGLVVTDDAAVAAGVRAMRDALPSPSRVRLLVSAGLEMAVAAATHPRVYPFTLHPVIRAFARIGIDLPTRVFEDDGSAEPRTARERPPAAWVALARPQLQGLGADRARRRAIAAALRSALAARGVRHQEASGPGDHPLFVTVLHPRRDALRAALLASGQDTQPTWMRPIAGDDGQRDAVAEQASEQGFYLPLHAGVAADEMLAALDRALGTIGG
jgi:dTDP-4-amino-4,6-dideoxygalactose transaminase